MSSGIDNRMDWTAHGAPSGDRVGPGLAKPGQLPPLANERRDVADTLLGKNNLVAIDSSGGDPYNATGRFFRR